MLKAVSYVANIIGNVTGISKLTGGVSTEGATDLGLGTNGSVLGAILDTANNLIIGRSTKLSPTDANSIQVMNNGPQYVIMNTTAGSGQSYKLNMSQFGTMFFLNANGDGVYLIEVVENGSIQVRTKTAIMEDGK